MDERQIERVVRKTRASADIAKGLSAAQVAAKFRASVVGGGPGIPPEHLRKFEEKMREHRSRAGKIQQTQVKIGVLPKPGVIESLNKGVFGAQAVKVGVLPKPGVMESLNKGVLGAQAVKVGVLPKPGVIESLNKGVLAVQAVQRRADMVLRYGEPLTLEPFRPPPTVRAVLPSPSANGGVSATVPDASSEVMQGWTGVIVVIGAAVLSVVLSVIAHHFGLL